MKKCRRFASLLMAVLMFMTVLPPFSVAAPTVYFTSVNDTILNLSDETMPFWQGNMLYVPHTAIDDGRMPKELGIYCSYNREKQLVTLIQSRKVLIADVTAGTIYDRDEKYYEGKAIVRGDVAFLPIDPVAKYFDLQYSYTKVTNGYLVRIRNGSAVLSDGKFIDAASAPMAQRYSQYEKTHQSGGRTDGADGSNGDSAALTAYLAFFVSDVSVSETLLAALGSGAATFVFDASALAGGDDLLRHIVAAGSTLALRIDASAGAERTVDAIVRANDALWAACNSKTRLVLLDNAAESVTEAVEAAGYCPVRFALDYSENLPSDARAANGILSKADGKSACTVLMGRDTEVQSAMGAIAAKLRTNNCALARLNEVTAQG